MGWFRGLGRRWMNRLEWNLEERAKTPSVKYIEKKERMTSLSNKKRGYTKPS